MKGGGLQRQMEVEVGQGMRGRGKGGDVTGGRSRGADRRD